MYWKRIHNEFQKKNHEFVEAAATRLRSLGPLVETDGYKMMGICPTDPDQFPTRTPYFP